MGQPSPVQSLLRSEQRPAFWESAPDIRQHLPSYWLTWHQAGRGSASDLTDLEEDKDTLELLPKGCSMVENIGVGHLDQLTGLGVRDLEAAEETGGRPVVEASDSNSYPQPGLPPPASLFFPSVM